MIEIFFVIIIISFAFFFIVRKICRIFSGKNSACDCDAGNSCKDCPSSGPNNSIMERSVEKDN